MRFTSRLIFAALIALCWSGLAVANPNEPTPSLDTSALRAVTNMQLDSAFERFVSQGRGQTIHGLAGPSSMDCSAALVEDGIETCLVTTQNPVSAVPLSLSDSRGRAHHDPRSFGTGS
jgi:hypothetical protein